jgi:arylformamidase
LLSAGVLILEGLDLGAVTPGRYHLACLPLKLVGSDGVPARAVLLPASSD